YQRPTPPSRCTSACPQLVFTTQPSNTVAAGSPLPTGGVISVEDAAGNLVVAGPLASATITLSDSSGNGNLSGTTSVTSVNGIATVPNDSLIFEKGGVKSLQGQTTVPGYGTITGL